MASYINGSGVRVPSVSLTIVDSDALRASDYELRSDPADPAGTYRLTRLSDGTSQSVISGAIVDGFRVDVATPLPVARDASCCSRSHRRSRTSGACLTTRPAWRPHRRSRDGRHANTGTAPSHRERRQPLTNPDLTATITFTKRCRRLQLQPGRPTGACRTSGTGTWIAGQPVKLTAGRWI